MYKIPIFIIFLFVFSFNTVSAITFQASSNDGYLQNDAGSFSEARADDPADVVYYTSNFSRTTYIGHTGSVGQTTFARPFLNFDTSGLADDIIIGSSTLYLYVIGTADICNDSYSYIQLTGASNPSSSVLTTNDWDQVSSSTYSNTYDTTNITTSAWLAIELTDFSWINKTGWTAFSVRTGQDIENTAGACPQGPTGFNYTNVVEWRTTEYGTSTAPYLVVETITEKPTPTSTLFSVPCDLAVSSTSDISILYGCEETYYGTSTSPSITKYSYTYMPFIQVLFLFLVGVICLFILRVFIDINRNKFF